MRPQFKLITIVNYKLNYLLCIFSFLTLTAQEDFKGLKHWEIPSKNPDRIILTFYGDPTSSRAVTWRTSEEI